MLKRAFFALMLFAILPAVAAVPGTYAIDKAAFEKAAETKLSETFAQKSCSPK